LFPHHHPLATLADSIGLAVDCLDPSFLPTLREHDLYRIGDMLATSQQVPRAVSRIVLSRRAAPTVLAATRRGYATPSGPPPSKFRLKKQPDFNDGNVSTLDKMGNYFLMTEMFRGMYVAMEQFFRPP
jgi:hypothetical protein